MFFFRKDAFYGLNGLLELKLDGNQLKTLPAEALFPPKLQVTKNGVTLK